MKFCYKIFPERRAIVARYAGALTLSELVASAETMWADPSYSRKFDGIADISDASLGVAMSDFRALLGFLRDHHRTSQGRWAAVATTPFATACGMMYRGALFGRHTLEIFSTWEAACNFINGDLPSDVSLGGGDTHTRPR